MRPHILFLVFLVSTGAIARTRPVHRYAVDPLYGPALAAANHFLVAWQNQDHETGIMMLSDKAREHASPDQLQAFFSPGEQAAFEIGHGRRVGHQQYEFPVVLFDASESTALRRGYRLVVRETEKDGWVVDGLP